MRFKNVAGDFRIYAVTGTNTVSFAIDCDPDKFSGLLGFTVDKEYVKPDGTPVRATVRGYKVFRDREPNPVPGQLYSTYDNPVQSFTWDDPTAYPGQDYKYHFTPLYGSPLNIDRKAPVTLEVKTEPAWAENEHSVFFNRGVAASQAYASKFGNKRPDEVGDDRAYNWLSRGLKESIYKFIDDTSATDALNCSFYEFRFDGVLQRIRSAADRGTKVQIIYDAKENEHLDSGVLVESFPKVENEKAIKIAGLDTHPNVTLIPRTRNKSYISHNKFMIRLVNGVATSVYTGSTNISRGGIFGQTNVGHALDDVAIASMFQSYWDALSTDPDSASLKATNVGIQDDLTLASIPDAGTAIFSPRTTNDMLKFYADLLDSAESCACITLAFGVNDTFIEALSDNTTNNALTFLLLEKDAAGKFDYIYQNNVVKAVGSYIPDDVLYRWTRERNTQSLGLNTHVKYVHTKFLLKDPLSEKPVVVTGSANFSVAAMSKNDENMLVISGNRRVADIYFTEYMRIFVHYYFRWIATQLADQDILESDNPAFLKPDDRWTQQYRPGRFKHKRVQVFSDMYVP